MVKLVKKITKIVNKVGVFISIIVNSFLLLIVYFIGVGITFIAAKLVGKHFIEKYPSQDHSSYWNIINLRSKNTNKYYKQF